MSGLFQILVNEEGEKILCPVDGRVEYNPVENDSNDEQWSSTFNRYLTNRKPRRHRETPLPCPDVFDSEGVTANCDCDDHEEDYHAKERPLVNAELDYSTIRLD